MLLKNDFGPVAWAGFARLLIVVMPMKNAAPTAFFAVLLLLLPGNDAAIAQSCPRDTIEISRTQTAHQLRLECKCRLGFARKPGKTSCMRYIPESDLKRGTRFAVVQKSGKVQAFIRSGSPPNVKTYAVEPAQIMSANLIATGENSHLVMQLPSGKRVSFGPNTALVLGDPLDEFDLNLLAISGVIRLDSPKAKSSLEKLQKVAHRALGYSRAYIRRAMSRRFRVRTPNACACVRGTDFLVRGKDNELTFQVIDGIVDLIPNPGKPGVTISLGAGEQGRIASDGKISKLKGSSGQDYSSTWNAETGLKSIPAFGE